MGTISGGPPKPIDIIQNCSVLFGDISCSFLPYFERHGVAVNYFTLFFVNMGTLTQKILAPFFVLGIKSSGYNHTQFLNLY